MAAGPVAVALGRNRSRPSTLSLMRYATLAIQLLLLAGPASTQTPRLGTPPVATDVTALDIDRFIDDLPRDRVSDRPIRTVEVPSDYSVGGFGVLRPREVNGNAIVHHMNTTEIYYMLDGAGTLVTGGTITDQADTGTRGAAIAGGVTRRIMPGDVVIIPGHTPRW